MASTVSLKARNAATISHLSNYEIVLKQIAESGKTNKWEIQKKIRLPYPRVCEAAKILEKKGLVARIGQKPAKNKLPSPLYGLTFKGAITYLSLEDLKQPIRIGYSEEPIEDFKRRVIRSEAEYVKELRKLRDFLKNVGGELDYEIFKQIDWLLENYGTPVLSIIKSLAKEQATNPPYLFKAIEKNQKTEEQKLVTTIDALKKMSSPPKITWFLDNGKGNRVTEEIDLLKDEENRLILLRKNIDLSLKNENEYWRKTYSSAFFERLAYIKKDKDKKNASLARLGRELLEERKKTLTSLSEIVERLEKGE